MDIKCSVCQRFIGRETQGKLYDDKGKKLADDELVGYCINCRNLVVWRSAGVVTIDEAQVPQAQLYTPPRPEVGLESLPINEDLPATIKDKMKNQPAIRVEDEPIRLPNKPVKPHPLTPLTPLNNGKKPVPPVVEPTIQSVPVTNVKVAPMFVTFGKSKIYHMVNHFEDKIEKAQVLIDTTGYTLCKICDGFVEAMNE